MMKSKLGLLTVMTCCLIFGLVFVSCNNGSNGSLPGDELPALTAAGTFTSDIGSSPAALLVNFGPVSSKDQIGEVVSGTITDNGKNIALKGAYDPVQGYFSLSGGEEYLIYYVEGYIDSSIEFKSGTNVKIAINKDGKSGFKRDAWEIKAKRSVTAD
jgi:hypothetical protein